MVVECPHIREPFPAEWIQRSRALLEVVTASLRHLPQLRQASGWFQKRCAAYQEEMAHLAEVLDVSCDDLWLANLSYDLTLSLFGCSTMVLPTPEGPIVARNMDWLYEDRIARASCILSLPGGLSAGFVGAVGVVSGLSRHGFAVILNAIAVGGLHPEGYPVLMFLRYLLDQARSFAEAVQLTRETPLASSGLITLVGTSNEQRVCLERMPTRCEERWAREEEVLVVTNHYRALSRPVEGTCSRYQYVQTQAPRLPRPVQTDDLLRLLNHEQVRQEITAQHVVACPSKASLRLFVPRDLLEQPADSEGTAWDLSQLFRLN
jgi:predicted choloylglycine hydrolase